VDVHLEYSPPGFSLREGTYTIYAVSQPVGRNALSAVYGSIEISLTQSGESIPTMGTITITTSPPGAAVYIDSQYIGITPHSLEATPGPHTYRIEYSGYQTILESLTVKGGETTAIEKVLVPVATITTTATVPPTTRATSTTLPPVPAATTTPPLPLSAVTGILATGAALLFQGYRKK